MLPFRTSHSVFVDVGFFNLFSGSGCYRLPSSLIFGGLCRRRTCGPCRRLWSLAPTSSSGLRQILRSNLSATGVLWTFCKHLWLSDLAFRRLVRNGRCGRLVTGWSVTPPCSSGLHRQRLWVQTFIQNLNIIHRLKTFFKCGWMDSC